MVQRTTTSYAVLGLLALRPMSAYELAQQYKRSIGIASPRGDSAIYNEPKRLVADGLATARDDQRGRRTVAVYAITDAGRSALRAWLAESSPFPTIEAEPVVRALFADQGDPADLDRTIAALVDAARARRRFLASIGAEYLAGTGPYPERLDLVALTGKFALDLFDFLERWGSWAQEALAEWPEERSDREAWALGVIEGFVDDEATRGPTVSGRRAAR